MPARRRILSLWFPRLAAERAIRQEGLVDDTLLAVLRDTGNMQVIASLSQSAEHRGLRLGQPMRDAMAMCPELVTRLENPLREDAFLASLRRWAGQFSPWVGHEKPGGLILDMTGCSHLFGGEEKLLDRIDQECARFGLTVRPGFADTVGAAWALARFAGQQSESLRTGDAIDQEARATRSRAAKRRHWERGGAAPKIEYRDMRTGRIAPPGRLHQTLGPLPIASLRLDPDTVTQLSRLGLRRVEDIIGMPRAGLSRRFGKEVIQRLDQALGRLSEPVSPLRPELHFAVRLRLPDPIGLEEDLLAAFDKLLPPLCKKLRDKGRGARRVRLSVFRTDETRQMVDVALARPSWEPERIKSLLKMQIEKIDAGFGIDVVRVHVLESERIKPHQQTGHLRAHQKEANGSPQDNALDDLIGRMGARIGLEQITRLHPAASHIPEKATTTFAVAWSDPVHDWPSSNRRRPTLIFEPEIVQAEPVPALPERFKWRGRWLNRIGAVGPERISPEWWLDTPSWRTGVRDYWRVEVETGERLWLYFAHGGTMSAGWFCQGEFC